MRKECKAAGIVDTSANLWKFYVNKCRNNLHLVLAMSPSGDKLRLRCRSFPGLISNCVIDWFFAWPASVRKSMFHFTDTTRGHLTMPGVVFFLDLSEFGPSRSAQATSAVPRCRRASKPYSGP